MILARTIQSISALFRRSNTVITVQPQAITTKPKGDVAAINSYMAAGGNFANEASYLCFGKCTGFDALLEKWSEEEKKYSDLGFRTISLDAFIRYVRGASIEHLINQPREDWEEPIYHAEIFRKHPPDTNNLKTETKINKSGTIQKQIIFTLPSTEQFLDPSIKTNNGNTITYTTIQLPEFH